MMTVRLVNCNKLLNNKNSVKRVLLKKLYSTVSQPAVQSTQESYEKQLKDFDTLTNITRKPRQKKPQKPPFAKNLFLGIFDTDILTYPQLEKEDVENLERDVNALGKLMKQNHMVDCDTLSNKYFRQNLSDYKAIGLQASQFLDGREYNVTESFRFLETLSVHNLRDNMIYNEQLGVQTLVKFAKEDLKKKYLHRLMKGESLSAFCMSEPVFADFNSMQTRASLSNDQKTWIVNGEKTWVVNGSSADVLIVFAVTDVLTKDIFKETKLTAFVVERDSPGISYESIDTSMEIANVIFKDTPVPAENIIGEVNKADKILTSIITEFRLSSGPPCITLTKQILNKLTKNIIDQSNDTNMLHQTDAIRGKIGEIVTSLYAMESIVYLTTGIIDSYENQDCELESAIVKIFCSQNCSNTSMTSLDVIGTPAMARNHWANKCHEESLKYLALHETNDSLKMVVALMGLQYAGIRINDLINKLRNPLFHGGFILKRMWTNRRNASDDPKLDLQLGDHIHPSLYAASQHLEYCVKRFQFGTELLLSRFGPEVVNRHMDLRRVADCIIDIYAMTACMGRASRSYCIGLQNANYEMFIANAFCNAAMERVKYNVYKIYVGEVLTNDENNRVISKSVFNNKGYFPKHPLARNF